jgi:hypothetical protein
LIAGGGIGKGLPFIEAEFVSVTSTDIDEGSREITAVLRL